MDMDVEVEDESDHSNEFEPDSEEESSSYDSDSDEEQHAAHESDKFIVFNKQLEQLLQCCQECGAVNSPECTTKHRVGSMVVIKKTCAEGREVLGSISLHTVRHQYVIC